MSEFEQVEPGDLIKAEDINQIAESVREIQTKLRGPLVFADMPAQTNWNGGTRRREVFMDSFRVSSGRPCSYYDVKIAPRDASGNKIPGLWSSPDNAIVLQVVNASSLPSGPSDSSTTVKIPYEHVVIGYEDGDSTAVVRLLNWDYQPASDYTPRLVKFSPSGKVLYALCKKKGSESDYLIASWDTTLATTLPQKSVPIGALSDVRDFTVLTNSSGKDIGVVVLTRQYSTSFNVGTLYFYGLDGRLIFSTQAPSVVNRCYEPSVRANRDVKLVQHTSITSDAGGFLYISGLDISESYSPCDGHAAEGDTRFKCAGVLSFSVDLATKKLSPSGIYLERGNVDGFGDHCSYSWIYSVNYSPTVGMLIVSAHNMHHQQHGTGNTISRRVIRALGRDLVPFGKAILVTTALGPIAGVLTDGGRTRVAWVGNYQTSSFTYYLVIGEHDGPFTGYGHVYVKDVSFDTGDITHVTIFGSREDRTYVSLVPTVPELVYYGYIGEPESAGTVDYLSLGSGSFPQYAITKPMPIEAVINTTVVTCADPSRDLVCTNYGRELVHDGSLLLPPSTRLGGYISSSYTYMTNRSAVLLRDKPSTELPSLAGGWGSLYLDDPDAWRDPNLGGAYDTRLYKEEIDTQAGMRNIRTCGAALTCSQVGCIPDPPGKWLYIPAVWTGMFGSDDPHLYIDKICASLPDRVPVFSTSTTLISGYEPVPVLEVPINRPYVSGDKIVISFDWQAHMLWRVQNQIYDIRTLEAYCFVQLLDPDGNLIRPTDQNGNYLTYSNGDPRYRLDYLLGRYSTTQDHTDLSSVRHVRTNKKSSHVYKKTATSTYSITVPRQNGATAFRLGFAVGAFSRQYEINNAEETGETGGIYVTNVRARLVR